MMLIIGAYVGAILFVVSIARHKMGYTKGVKRSKGFVDWMFYYYD